MNVGAESKRLKNGFRFAFFGSSQSVNPWVCALLLLLLVRAEPPPTNSKYNRVEAKAVQETSLSQRGPTKRFSRDVMGPYEATCVLVGVWSVGRSMQARVLSTTEYTQDAGPLRG